MMDILNGTRYCRGQCDDSDVQLCERVPFSHKIEHETLTHQNSTNLPIKQATKQNSTNLSPSYSPLRTTIRPAHTQNTRADPQQSLTLLERILTQNQPFYILFLSLSTMQITNTQYSTHLLLYSHSNFSQSEVPLDGPPEVRRPPPALATGGRGPLTRWSPGPAQRAARGGWTPPHHHHNAMTATFGFVGRRWIVTLLLMIDILNGTRYYRKQCDDSDVRLCGSTLDCHVIINDRHFERYPLLQEAMR